MKTSILFLLAICLIIGNPADAQKSGLLKKVTKSMTDELLGKPDDSSNKAIQEPEPACACNPAEIIFDLGGKLKLNYTEMNISVKDDGSVLVKDLVTGNFYIIKGSVTQGPIQEGDPRITGFENMNEDDNSMETTLMKYKEYISKSGEKYLITFSGKKYGPYAQIQNFVVTKSKDKFAAMAIENILITEDQGKKMEEAMKNAKNDQERMDLSMQFAQQMQQNMMKGGVPASISPILVSNIPNVTYDPMKVLGGTLDANMKYDDILMNAGNKIIDLQGKTILTIKPELAGATKIFVNTSNTKYAVVGYGNLTFSDNTTLSELFNPHLLKTDGKVYLAYMYYSPKKNAIMQCKIPF